MPDLDAVDPDLVELAPEEEGPAVGTWREATDVGLDESRQAWSEAARDVLIDTAKGYRGVVTQKVLCEQVQFRSGIRTKQPIRHWIGDVLGRVSAESAKRSEPLLASLCVNADGSVGDSYAAAVLAASGVAPSDPDNHAAKERLACHEFFEAANIPSDGGSPALTPKLAASRQRQRKINLAERVAPVCSKCFTQLPATGRCDYCEE